MHTSIDVFRVKGILFPLETTIEKMIRHLRYLMNLHIPNKLAACPNIEGFPISLTSIASKVGVMTGVTRCTSIIA